MLRLDTRGFRRIRIVHLIGLLTAGSIVVIAVLAKAALTIK